MPNATMIESEREREGERERELILLRSWFPMQYHFRSLGSMKLEMIRETSYACQNAIFHVISMAGGNLKISPPPLLSISLQTRTRDVQF